MSYFLVKLCYPPDLLHDLLEGIVPLELALAKSHSQGGPSRCVNSYRGHQRPKWMCKQNHFMHSIDGVDICPQPGVSQKLFLELDATKSLKKFQRLKCKFME